jgi:hypothetical protein
MIAGTHHKSAKRISMACHDIDRFKMRLDLVDFVEKSLLTKLENAI